MAEIKPEEEKPEPAKIVYNRMSISVPQELKDRMESCGETVNWSALACRMFEAKLGDIAQKRGVRTVEDAISRLRLTKHRRVGERFNWGRANGRQWAMNDSTADQLERLEEFFMTFELTAGGADLSRWIGTLRKQERDFPFRLEDEGAVQIASAIIGPESGHRMERAIDFASTHFFTPLEVNPRDAAEPSDKYVAGWVEGAVGFWREVKDKL